MYTYTPICTFNSHLSQRLLVEKSGETDWSRHLRTFAICKSAHSLKVSCETRHYMRIWLWVASSVQKCVDERELFKKKSTIVMRSLTPINDSVKSMAELCLGKSQIEKNIGTHSLTIISQKHSACRHTLVCFFFFF